VALWTRYVGQEAFDAMRQAGKILVVPPGAEKVAEGMDEITLLDLRHMKGSMILLRDICDPGVQWLSPNNVFDECLKHIVEDYCERLDVPATTQCRLFVTTCQHIRQLKQTNVFVHKSLMVVNVLIIEWCEHQRLDADIMWIFPED
jgi:hypothetical protein